MNQTEKNYLKTLAFHIETSTTLMSESLVELSKKKGDKILRFHLREKISQNRELIQDILKMLE